MKTQRSVQKRKAVLLGLLLALVVWLLLEAKFPSRALTRNVEFPTESIWMTVADESQPTGCYRLDFDLSREVDHAWVQVAVEGGFELICNGNTVGAFSHWRPTRPFQNGLTESGQRLHHSPPAMGLNFTREYQWTDHSNERVPVFFDLRPYLKKGQNTLCLATSARRIQRGMRLYGEIHLEGDETIPIYSGLHWKAEAVPKGLDQQSWVLPRSSVDSWRRAVPVKRSIQGAVSLVPRGGFETAFRARWISLPKGDSSSVLHRRVWDLDQTSSGAYLRVAANAPFVVHLNGVAMPSLRGEQEPFWNIEWLGRRSLGEKPELLDSEESTRYFGGSEFLNPRHGDPTLNDFKQTEIRLNRTTDRPTGVDGSQWNENDEEKGRESGLGPVIQEPNVRVPLALTRSISVEKARMYSVGHLLNQGENVLEVRVNKRQEGVYQRSRMLKLAYDLGYDEDQWLVSGDGELAAGEQVLASVATKGVLPRMKFVGHALPNRTHHWWALLCGVLVTVLLWKKAPPLPAYILFFGVSLSLFLALRVAYYERSELLWFRVPFWTLRVIIYSTIIAFLGQVVLFVKGRRPSSWRVILPIMVLGLCVFLRAWQVDFQPIDDDEFASIQAALAIAEKGVPEIAPGIYYTRSPFYHYVAGAAAWLFGPNLFTLRLLSVVASGLTAWLVWRVAKMVLKSDGLALTSALLFSLHPFLIFSGHLARFYQFQQLFVVLTIWLFFVGFLEGRSERWKLAAIGSFGLAIFSQEISIVLVVAFVVVWLLAGSSFSIKAHWKSVVAMGLLAFLVVLDFLTFKILCITRPVGVSPNVEATVAPGAWELSNLWAMFTANARLQILLSAFVLVSLIAAAVKKDRLVMSLHGILIFGIVAVNLLITSVSFRYQYALIPFWIILGVHGLDQSARYLGSRILQAKGQTVLFVIFVCAVIASWSPWRLIGSYQTKLLGDSISALKHVKSEWREGDKVMITEPHPHAALIELGQVDYDLSIPILYDFAYNDEGVLRDRNGNAEVVNRLARIQEIFTQEKRLWVVVNREKLRSKKKNIRWEYPGARVELFLRKNCDLAYRAYLWDVYLWDRSKGKVHTFRKESASWVE